jgi:hypothetical protein
MEDRLKLRVTGISPLLTHNPLSMLDKDDLAKGRQIPSPEEEAEAGVYRTADGSCAIPGVAFRSALVKASGAYRRGRRSLKSDIAHVQVEPELVPLRSPEGEPLTGYTVDLRRAVVQRQGVVRARPRFERWSADLEVIYDPELIEPDLIVQVMADAGRRIGVGDYRPEKSGWFGRFTVERL